MLLLTTPLQLSPMSMMPLVMLLTLLPLKLRLTSMTPQAMLQSPTSTWSPLLPPLLPHLPSLTLPTPTLDTPMPSLPTTPAVSTTLAALCPVPKRLPLRWIPLCRRCLPHRLCQQRWQRCALCLNAYPYAGYPYAVAAYHTGCVNNVGSVVPC